MSAYLFYYQANREKLAEANPNIHMKDIAKLASEKWNTLSNQEKLPFERKSSEQMEQYHKQMNAIEAKLPPKKPLPAFLAFSKEVRPTIVEQDPSLTFAEISSIIGEKWRDLDPAVKDEYIEDYKLRLQDWQKQTSH